MISDCEEEVEGKREEAYARPFPAQLRRTGSASSSLTAMRHLRDEAFV
jgi:hypothetical protein